MRLKNYWVGFVLVSLMSTGALAQKTAIVCKQLIDGTGKVTQNAVILIEADRIVAVGSKDSIPKGTPIIDLGSYTVLPGLVTLTSCRTNSLLLPTALLQMARKKCEKPFGKRSNTATTG